MSSATFCTSAPSSNCNTFTLMPVNSLKPLRFAAIAVVGDEVERGPRVLLPHTCFGIDRRCRPPTTTAKQRSTGDACPRHLEEVPAGDPLAHQIPLSPVPCH